jgi:hypothetical protein
MEKFNITEPKREQVETTYYTYFVSDKFTNAKINKMYDLSFRVNLVYRPKTIWFWIKKLFNNSKASK